MTVEKLLRILSDVHNDACGTNHVNQIPTLCKEQIVACIMPPISIDVLQLK